MASNGTLKAGKAINGKVRALILLAAALVSGISDAGAAESTGFTFLTLGAGARSLGMGEAVTASAADPTVTYYNPAGLTAVPGDQIVLIHRAWIQGVRSEFIGASVHTGSLHLGLAFNVLDIPDIEIRSAPGPAEGTFSARYASIGLSGAFMFGEGLSAGVGVKYLYEKILIDAAGGYGLDFGLRYESPSGLEGGIAIMNMGSAGTLANESSALPTTLRAGGSYTTRFESLDLDATGAADFVAAVNGGQDHFNVGAEALFHNTVALRVGYQTGFESRGITAGTGFRLGIVSVDYAFVPFQYDLGTTHTISVGLSL